MRVSIRLAICISLALLVAGASVGPAGPASAQAGDPEIVVQAFVDAVNDGHLDTAMSLVADDVVFTLSDSTQSQAGYGKHAFEVALGGAVQVNQQANITDITSEGNVVHAVAEVTDDEAQVAGIDRVIQLITMTVNDSGLITHADFTHDESDAETAEYLEHFFDPDATKPPPDVPSILMNEQSGSGQTGVAAMIEDPDAGLTIVAIDIGSGAEGVFQPAHLHTGTCENPGPIVQPLASVIGGASFTFLSVPPPSTDAGLVLNVHKSPAEPNVYVSCGVIEPVTAPAATPTAPPAAPPTATPATGVVAPNTGSGPSGEVGELPWLYAAAALSGGVVLGGLAIRRRSRQA